MLERLTRLKFIGLLLLTLLVVSVFLYTYSDQPLPPPAGADVDLWPGTDEWVSAQMESLTLEQKIGQIISYRENVSGLYAGSGGFGLHGIVAGGDASSVSAVSAAIEGGSPPGTGLHEAIRFAGLPWTRSIESLSQDGDYPRAMHLAIKAAGEPKLARGAAAHTARATRQNGWHSVAVIDIESGDLPGGDPQMLRAITEGIVTGGALATITVPADIETPLTGFWSYMPVGPQGWRLPSLISLFSTIEAGAHAIYVGEAPTPEERSALDRLSYHLRIQEQFDGLILSDVPSGASPEAVGEMLRSGVDLLITDDPARLYEYIAAAVEGGDISTSHIDEAAERVLRAKAWLGQSDSSTGAAAVSNGGASQRLGEIVAQRALTLVDNRGAMLPLQPHQQVLGLSLFDAPAPDHGATFANEVSQVVPDSLLTLQALPADPGEDAEERVLEQASDAAAVIVAVYPDRQTPARIATAHARLLQSLVEANTPVAILVMGSPEVLEQLPSDMASVVWSPSRGETAQRQAARSLFGHGTIRGSLPFASGGRYDAGHGIEMATSAPTTAPPEAAGMRPGYLARIDSLLLAGVAQRAFPGASAAVGRGQYLVHTTAAGRFTYGDSPIISPSSLFDLASLTKPLVTTTAVMQLYEDEQIDLEAPVSDYLPEFTAGGKQDVQIRHLLDHSGGLPSFRPFHIQGFESRDDIIRAIMEQPLDFLPGTDFQYSDLGMISLALVVERVSGQPFAEYAWERIFRPLRMYDTGFKPVGAGGDEAVVPTERDRRFRGRLMQGEVHDETAYLLGGATGHAGLFSTVEDLAIFGYMLVNEGRIYGKQFLEPETIELFTRPTDRERSTRALGWDTRTESGYSSAGQYFGPNSYGHTGFTGTSFWVDPDEQLFAILLTNRVYPSRANRTIIQIRPQFADMAHRAISGPIDLLVPGLP